MWEQQKPAKTVTVTQAKVTERQTVESVQAEKVIVLPKAAPKPVVIRAVAHSVATRAKPQVPQRLQAQPVALTEDVLQTAKAVESTVIPLSPSVRRNLFPKQSSLESLVDSSAIENASLTRLDEAAAKHGDRDVQLLNSVVKPQLLKNGVAVEFRAADKAMETGAYFVPRDNIIAISEADVLSSKRTLESVLDDILFESFNAGQRDRYLALEKETNPITKGTETAQIEFEATLGYIKEANTISVMGMPVTDRAQNALSWAVNTLGAGHDLEYLTSTSDDSRKLREDFLTSPHDRQATSGEATMPTPELYQYQAISDLGVNQFVALLKERLPESAPTMMFGARRKRAKDPAMFAGWVKNIYPTKDNADRRPFVYAAILDEAQKQFGTRFDDLKPAPKVVEYAKRHGKIDVQPYTRYLRSASA